MTIHHNGKNYPDLLTPAEVAAIFRVTTAQVARWAKAGRLNSIRTLGNHRRFDTAEVLAFLNGGSSDGGGLS